MAHVSKVNKGTQNTCTAKKTPKDEPKDVIDLAHDEHLLDYHSASAHLQLKRPLPLIQRWGFEQLARTQSRGVTCSVNSNLGCFGSVIKNSCFKRLRQLKETSIQNIYWMWCTYQLEYRFAVHSIGA
eukprot:5664495-Amphidinium_carterae.1